MKTSSNWAWFVWILVLQITIFDVSLAQDHLTSRDTLVAPLPEILITASGMHIETAEQWEQLRRPELLELFKEHVYGRVPDTQVNIRHRLVFEDREALDGSAVLKEVVMEIYKGEDTLQVDMLIFLPKDIEGPVPLFLGLNFYGNQSIHADPRISITDSWVRNSESFGIENNRATEASRGVRASRWPVELILSRGYGLATIHYGDIDPDFHDGFLNGIQGLMDPAGLERGSDSWGSIAAWAWGLSRAMDYFERDVEIDQYRVAVMGHSRLGKTSLWAGALDERFALVISNNSGCGGAALSRRPYGERVRNINSSFPHWFASRFHAYNDNESALPVDQHMLMALVAPRPLYVASAQEDNWADPGGEYLSLFHGSQAHKLYQEDVALNEEMPGVDKPVKSGMLGYHIRSGAHDVKRYDWEQYLDFADEHMPASAQGEYDNPVSREWIQERLLGSHPRLILTPQLEYLIGQQVEGGDSLVADGLELIKRYADSIVLLEPLERIQTGRRLLGVSREAISRLTTLSLSYSFLRNPEHLQRLEEELNAVCSFRDWNPSHFLDVAEMACGVALALDWTGEWLSPDVDSLARSALIEKALKPGLGTAPHNWWIDTDNNWNLVCHGGLSMAALVVFEDAPELATDILRQAVDHIPLALGPYAPEGIYPEGTSYWTYATTYLTTALSAFESALGTDFGFTRAPGVMESAVFSQVMAGPSGEYYNFFDSSLGGFHSLSHFGLLAWFARRSGSGLDWDAYASLLHNELSAMQQLRSTRFYPVFFLDLARMDRAGTGSFYWPGCWSGGGGEPVVIMREGQNMPGSFFLAAKGGRAADNHGNMDAGSFIFELGEVRWSLDPGNQSYNALEQIMGGGLWSSAQDSPRWTLLTKNSGGHSTLVINGEPHLADARAPLVRREMRGEIPLFTFDLSGLYGDHIRKARRTFSKLSATRLRISDELEFSALTRRLSWQMITRAQVLEVDGGLRLDQDNSTLFLRIPSDIPHEVRVISLYPPPLEYDKQIEGLKRVEIHWDRDAFPGDAATLRIELDSTPL